MKLFRLGVGRIFRQVGGALSEVVVSVITLLRAEDGSDITTESGDNIITE